MSLKHQLGPWLASGARLWGRLAHHGDARFPIAILHDIHESDTAALIRLLDLIQRERGFLKPSEIDRWLTSPRGTVQADARPAPCLLTFDDGFASALPVAREILSRYGISAVFFVCPGLIDLPQEHQAATVSRNVFQGKIPPQDVPSLMGWRELEQLQHLGHVIGAHGMNHIKLSTAAAIEADAEIIEAGLSLERHLGHKPDWYAYAFGDIESISARTLQIIQKHYRYCRSGVRGDNGQDNVSGLLNAQEIDLGAPQDYLRAVLDGALDIRYIAARRRLRAYANP